MLGPYNIVDVILRDVVSRGSLVKQAIRKVKGPVQHADHRLLLYKSYNPLLVQRDFAELLPENQLRLDIKETESSTFDLHKVRDGRFFMFRDKYLLQFASRLGLRSYLRSTEHTFLDERILGLKEPGDKILYDYAVYQRNLKAAFTSQKAYEEALHTEPEKVEDITAHLSTSPGVKDIEAKSVLVWDFPSNFTSEDIKATYWWYGIKTCFKLYSDETNGKTLTYLAFYDNEEASKFTLNMHGAFSADGKALLVEAL
ncbi:HBL257Cp [Eremothecium sinecaudum]|uniref:HBL257Cp n=1 Tax=Eremothecium sinecaudum TaxID=45286 RepID=A0A120K0S9_9SACH|nr:HBL257Cp [Eremothecium sinecaudum]AMD18645.1 HBL257Cp [Eremothecium sinecaudum]